MDLNPDIWNKYQRWCRLLIVLYKAGGSICNDILHKMGIENTKDGAEIYKILEPHREKIEKMGIYHKETLLPDNSVIDKDKLDISLSTHIIQILDKKHTYSLITELRKKLNKLLLMPKPKRNIEKDQFDRFWAEFSELLEKFDYDLNLIERLKTEDHLTQEEKNVLKDICQKIGGKPWRIPKKQDEPDLRGPEYYTGGVESRLKTPAFYETTTESQLKVPESDKKNFESKSEEFESKKKKFELLNKKSEPDLLVPENFKKMTVSKRGRHLAYKTSRKNRTEKSKSIKQILKSKGGRHGSTANKPKLIKQKFKSKGNKHRGLQENKHAPTEKKPTTTENKATSTEKKPTSTENKATSTEKKPTSTEKKPSGPSE